MTIDKKSLINWVAGKRLLRKTIAPLIPARPYLKLTDEYLEEILEETEKFLH